MNKLLPELLQIDSKPLGIAEYRDNQSLHDAAHSTKQTLEKRLIADISPVEMVDKSNSSHLDQKKRRLVMY